MLAEVVVEDMQVQLQVQDQVIQAMGELVVEVKVLMETQMLEQEQLILVVEVEVQHIQVQQVVLAALV
jgi:hypothetical protein